MKFYYLLSVAVLFAFASCNKGTCSTATSDVKLTSSVDSLSYYLGMVQGKGMASRAAFKGIPGDTIVLNAFWAGLNAGYTGNGAILDSSTVAAETYLQGAFRALQSKAMEVEQAKADANKNKGIAFLADNAKRKGVVVTKSGLQYEVVKPGSGPAAKATDKVKVDYEGTLIDGTVFDSSIKRGEPITFPVNGVIPGWTEALQLMKKGAEYKLYIPSELAYGPRGAGAQIPGNSVLIFKVTLLEINPKAEAPAGKK